MMTSLTPYDTHHGVVNTHGKFDGCTFSSYREVKADRQTGRQTELRFIYLDLYACAKKCTFAAENTVVTSF